MALIQANLRRHVLLPFWSSHYVSSGGLALNVPEDRVDVGEDLPSGGELVFGGFRREVSGVSEPHCAGFAPARDDQIRMMAWGGHFCLCPRSGIVATPSPFLPFAHPHTDHLILCVHATNTQYRPSDPGAY